MFLSSFIDDIETYYTIYFIASVIVLILFCLLVYYAFRIKKMIQFYFERDGGEEWERKKNAERGDFVDNTDEEKKSRWG